MNRVLVNTFTSPLQSIPAALASGQPNNGAVDRIVVLRNNAPFPELHSMMCGFNTDNTSVQIGVFA